MKTCVFCEAIKGAEPASFVYRDDLISVIIPHNPFTPGHSLIIPNKHAQSILELKREEITRMAEISQKVASAISHSKFKSEGINLWLNDGKNAGQNIMHVHLHVFPRYAGDGFDVSFHSNEQGSDRSYLDSIAKELKINLSAEL